MKIYAITSGNYSDYHIVGITLNKESAENIKETYDRFYGGAEIEEYNELTGIKKQLWYVTIGFSTGYKAATKLNGFENQNIAVNKLYIDDNTNSACAIVEADCEREAIQNFMKLKLKKLEVTNHMDEERFSLGLKFDSKEIENDSRLIQAAYYCKLYEKLSDNKGDKMKAALKSFDILLNCFEDKKDISDNIENACKMILKMQ